MASPVDDGSLQTFQLLRLAARQRCAWSRHGRRLTCAAELLTGCGGGGRRSYSLTDLSGYESLQLLKQFRQQITQQGQESITPLAGSSKVDSSTQETCCHLASAVEPWEADHTLTRYCTAVLIRRRDSAAPNLASKHRRNYRLIISTSSTHQLAQLLQQ